MLLQPGFCQINVTLDAAQDFIADYVLIAKFNGSDGCRSQAPMGGM